MGGFKKVACYIRVSTVGQNLAGQKREIMAWLSGNGIDPENVVWFVDRESGDSLARPGFERLQKAIFAGEVGTVVVWKLDRLSRKLRDGLDVLCDWSEKGLRIVSVTQQIDLSGTVGRMIAAVLLGVAEMEQSTRRERQKAGIDAARERGVYLGRKAGSTKADKTRAKALLEKGMTHSEIGLALGVSRRTVLRYIAG
ncbi:MAG: recombinase family protein [Pirellulaceae bacterium]